MTAYLATSPGGLDTVAIGHAGTRADDVVYYGAEDAAAAYHFVDRPGDGAGYLPPCAAAIKASQRGLGRSNVRERDAPGQSVIRLSGGQRGVVVRLFGDFVHQLAVTT